MIFSELHSAYYATVAKILTAALEGDLSEKSLRRIVAEQAFSESALTLLPALREQQWQLLHADLSTPLRHRPTLPPTLLEKRWLKAIMLDARIRLFDVQAEGLEDVTPLFTAEDYRVYDRYADGDPYADAGYGQRFREILAAVRDQATLRVEATSRKGKRVTLHLVAQRLEYSVKDDKFRLLSPTGTVNLARITSCARVAPRAHDAPQPFVQQKKSVTLLVTDERRALERALLHFCDLEKSAVRLEDGRYQLRLLYDPDDETELVIRVLSFGPLARVTEPEEFCDLIRQRLLRQKRCGFSPR